jgi:hypothetical protein
VVHLYELLNIITFDWDNKFFSHFW